MALRDYGVNRDKFEIPETGIVGIDDRMAFPCCCCMHHDKSDSVEPCRTCDHNTNAAPINLTPNTLSLIHI